MRYSLRTLMYVMLWASVACCVFFALPTWLCAIILGFFMVAVPGAIVAWIVYGDGYGRAFAIGCATATGILYGTFFRAGRFVFGDVIDAAIFDDDIFIKIGFLVICVSIAISGCASMGVRWLIVRNAQTLPKSTSPPADVDSEQVVSDTIRESPLYHHE